VVAASDYMRLFAEQIRAWVPQRFHTLGTDGYGRSDTRAQLRHFFEVDRYHIAFETVTALVADGKLPKTAIGKAMKQYRIDSEKPDPVSV